MDKTQVLRIVAEYNFLRYFMELVCVKKIDEQTKRLKHYAYLDLGYRRIYLPFGNSSIVTNAELLGISVQQYLDLEPGEYNVMS